MKKAALLIFVGSFSVPAFSQFQSALKAGLNYSHLHTNYDYSYKWGLSMHIGLALSYSFNGKWGLVSEFLISDKGNGGQNYRNHLIYFNIPTMVRYNFLEKFSADVGFESGYLLYAFYMGSEVTKSTIYTNKADFGLAGGINYKLASRWSITLRYETGLSNVIGKDARINLEVPIGIDPPFVQPTLREQGFAERNQNLQLSVNYMLTDIDRRDARKQ